MTTNDDVSNSNPFEGPDLTDSTEFFDSLDKELGTVEKMEQPTPIPEQVTSQQVIPDAAGQQGNEQVANQNIDWKKRYDDSSKEARRQQAELKELQPFKSVINFLKEDSGAVELLQGYLKNGGEVPKNMQQELKLDEDFMFDMDEATKDPESDSGKLFNRMVEKKAQAIVNNTLQQERQRAIESNRAQQRARERQEFMDKKGYTEEDMKILEDRAKTKTMTYDDLDYLINREKIAQNVQRSTQQDMMNQMNAVRDIPTSIGGTNNAGAGMTSEESFFNDVFGDQFQNDDNPF